MLHRTCSYLFALLAAFAVLSVGQPASATIALDDAMTSPAMTQFAEEAAPAEGDAGGEAAEGEGGDKPEGDKGGDKPEGDKPKDKEGDKGGDKPEGEKKKDKEGGDHAGHAHE